jgi:hypothetical protein
VRGLRGYVWSTSGYSASGGFWLSAAYYGNGLFLVDASRNGKQCTDLDMLIHAFKHGVVTPDDPGMLTSALYTSELVYLDMSRTILPVVDKQSLLSSPACRTTRQHGYHRASILEFIPMARSAAQPNAVTWPGPAVRPSAPPTVRSSVPAAPRPAPAPPGACTTGPWCPHCGAEVKERPLFFSTYVGCLC